MQFHEPYSNFKEKYLLGFSCDICFSAGINYNHNIAQLVCDECLIVKKRCFHQTKVHKVIMATLEKLSIRGVRSFGTDPEDEQASQRQ